MPGPVGYFLISHGSRDPRSQAALDEIARLFTQALAQQRATDYQNSPLVQTGCLEFGSTNLEQQIQQFGASLITLGAAQLTLLPLFLHPGAHVMEDIPTAVSRARQRLGTQITLSVRSYLGSHPGMELLLRDRIAPCPAHTWILLAHGSRRIGGNAGVEHLAAQLGAVPAYWSGSPNLEARLEELATQGSQEIGILPYFLFTGRITDTIIEQVNQLRLKFNQFKIKLLHPLDPSFEVASLLLDLI